jgi:uncharacterized phiE125 gp8 family phage protein
VVKVVTPPTAEPVSLDDFKSWMQGLPISAEQEPMVLSLLKAGREEAEAYQNAAYCEQTLQLTVEPELHQKAITLPRPPFRELQNVTVILPDGTQQDMTAHFEVHNDGGPAEMVLKSGENMPNCRLQITYTAGYDTVPDRVKQAILLYATWAWMHRGGDTTVPAAFYALLSKDRVIPV